MEIIVRKQHGLQNCLVASIGREELETVCLHITNRERLMRLPGLRRHSPRDERFSKDVAACKKDCRAHLLELRDRGCAYVDGEGRPRRRVLVIGARNLGNNHRFVAWQNEEQPRLFHVAGDPLGYLNDRYLTLDRSDRLQARTLTLKEDGVLENDLDISSVLRWCMFANCILQDGKVVSIEDTIEHYYDIAHVLALDRAKVADEKVLAEIYEGYPTTFRTNALRALVELRVPRNRFLHNVVGLSSDRIFIVQREGTPEELGSALADVGAQDAFILDNGGSRSEER